MDNAQIADALVAEARQLEGFRAAALLTAGRIIRELPTPVTDAQQLKGIRGIGAGTIKRVQAILSQGSAYQPAVAEPTPATPADDRYDFTLIPFFGPAKRQALYSQGITTREQLLEAVRQQTVELTKNQLAGLEYQADLAERIPRDEVAFIGREVLAVARGLGLTGQIVGSYRRGKESSGDVDVLVTGAENRLAELVAGLPDRIEYTYSLGPVKFMGVAVGPLTGYYRSLDIRYVPPEIFGSALLFATGPYELNIHQRRLAIEQGFKLSEYGLFNADNQRLPPSSDERAIFEAIGMPYLQPEERERFNTE